MRVLFERIERLKYEPCAPRTTYEFQKARRASQWKLSGAYWHEHLLKFKMHHYPASERLAALARSMVRSPRALAKRPALGDSLAVELPALTRAALVRIQVPQPNPRNSLHFKRPVADAGSRPENLK